MEPDLALFAVEKIPHVLSLAERFTVPPFTILDGRGGWWQDRKRSWIDLGIESELGRDARTFVKRGDRTDGFAAAAAAKAGKAGALENLDEVSAKILALSDGISIFDPVLAELSYRWYCPPGGIILDPFAGGSVRGLVAAFLGRRYVGVELRAEQVEANRAQVDPFLAKAPDGAPVPKWHVGDSAQVLVDWALMGNDPAAPLNGGREMMGGADFVFSCPPYHDLEVYSDDPADLSKMDWGAFLEAYRAIISLAVAHLNDNRFAAFVVGEIRAGARGVYRNFVGETIRAFTDAGADYYNEGIFVQPAGTLPIRAGRQFAATRKLGRCHQTILVFVKGDPKAAADAIGAAPGLDVEAASEVAEGAA